MANNTEIPKQELLTKLLKMTTSPNDGEALTAMRKANALLTTAGWDWDKLISGKIVVVADPFASIPTPPPQEPRQNDFVRSAPKHSPGPFAPRQAAHVYSTPPRTAPPPPPPPRGPVVGSNKTNMYGNHCYCCGVKVNSKMGFIFNPAHHNTRAANIWETICATCNSLNYITIAPMPAPKLKPPHIKPDLSTF